MHRVALVLCALVAWPVAARAEAAEHDAVLGGDHWRFATPNGAVHVWRPTGYDAPTAGLVIYVHGHGDTADSAFTRHRLAQQFRESGRNALFVVPEAQGDGEAEIPWESLGALLRATAAATGVARPPGPLVVVGHSGAYRTLVAWLGHAAIEHLVLLDALYAEDAAFLGWLEGGRARGRRKLTIVSRTTRKHVLGFLAGIGDAVTVKRIPADWAKLGKRERTARVVHFRSQYDHMGIVTSGKVIPLMLRRTALTGL